MEMIVLLGLLFLGYVIIFPIYLTQRIAKLQHQLDQFMRGGQSQTPPASVGSPRPPTLPSAPVAPATPAQPAVAQTAHTTPVYTPAPPNPFVEWMKEDFLLKLGALLLLLAFGWLVSYAFANDWIGPVGRILLGLLSGLGIVGLGIWRIQRYLHQGSIFIGLGAGVMLVSLFAARAVYEMFTAPVTLVMMFLTVLLVAYVSVQYRSAALSYGALLVGSFAPYMALPDEPNIFWFMMYMLTIVVGTLWVVWLRRLPYLTPLALGVMCIHSIAFWSGQLSFDEQMTGLYFAFVFTAIFFVSNIVSICFSRRAELDVAHLLAAFGTGLYILLWIMITAPSSWQTLLYVAWALVFVVGAFAVYQRTAFKVPFYLYSGTALVLLGAATINEVATDYLTIVFTIEVLLVLIAAHFLLRERTIVQHLTWLMVIPVMLSLQHLDAPAWYLEEFSWHLDALSLGVVMVALYIVGRIVYTPDWHGTKLTAAMAMQLLAAVYAATLVWLITHRVLAEDTATGLSLVIYTISGLACYITAQRVGSRALHMVGLVILGLVVARLLLVDVWALSIVGRIITFFAVGVLLLSTAFIRKQP